MLDPTCGSGTTAYVAEQWGRRWITCDTSRVALALARTRLMAAKYAYYLLADVSSLGCASDREAAARILSLAGVTSVPGSSFYANPADGARQVRFCFAKKPADLQEACRRLRELPTAASR